MPSSETLPTAGATDDRAVRVILVGFAVYLFALAILALVAPRAFFEKVGPFGPNNPHYTRDEAIFEFALGVGAAVAVSRQSWRVPLLATMALQSLLHSINHLSDIANAPPRWLGPFDFVGLAIGTVVLAWALARARRQVARQ